MTDPCYRYHTTAVVLTTIYSPFTEGTSRVMKTNEGNSLLWGASVAGAPFGPRGSVAWVPVLGLSAAVGSGCLLRTYRTSTTTTTQQPLLQLRTLQPLLQLRTLQLFFPSHPPYNSNYITDTRGLVPERA